MANQLFEISVKALLFDEQDRLLVLARHSHRGDLFWDLPGGRLRESEDLGSALRRELRDELGEGLPQPTDPRPLDAQIWDEWEGPPKLLLYMLSQLPESFEPLLSGEHASYLWIGGLEELELLGGEVRLEEKTRELLALAFAERRR